MKQRVGGSGETSGRAAWGGLTAVVVAGLMAAAVGGCAHQNKSAAPVAHESDPNNAHVRRLWLSDLTLKHDSAEAIYLTSDKLFLYTENNQVFGISRTGGTIQWGAQVGEPASSILPPLEAGDRTVFPCNTRMFIYDRNGVLDHAQDVGFAMHAPGVSDGKNMIYIPAAHHEGQRVAAVDINRKVGEVIWEFLTRGPVTAAPTLYAGILYVGSEDNRVYAVTNYRRPVWPLEGFAFETAGRIIADVRADDSGVYFASTDTKLYCVDRQTGKIKWTYYGEAPLSTPPTLTSDSVYQFSPGKGLVALDKQGVGNRTPRWVQREAAQVLSTGTRGVYVRFLDNSIGALDKATGNVLWRGAQKYDRFVQNTTDATIFAATKGGAVSAYLPVGEAMPQRVARPTATSKPGVMMPKPAAAPANP